MTSTFQLRRDSFGKLVLTGDEGEEFVGVMPVRSFPVQAPTRGISLVRDGGKEVAWIDDLDVLPPDIRALVAEELEGANSCPRFPSHRQRVEFRHALHLDVKTDRGDTEFVLKVEEDIRRSGDGLAADRG
jgi:hypothetical protein